MRTFIYCMLLLFSFSASAYYSNFAYSIIDNKGNRMIDTNNVIKVAIEQNQFIPLAYNDEFTDASNDLFKQVDEMGNFELNAFASPRLVKGIQDVVREFACATYRFNANKGQARECNGLVKDKRVKEGQPFLVGQFVDKPIMVSTNSIRPGMPARSYDIFLPSAKSFPLKYAWGAVHELGSFFVRERERNDTVLTIYINGFKLDANGERSPRMTKKPEIIFVVIPKASTIGNQASQNAAADFALANAEFIVPYY